MTAGSPPPRPPRGGPAALPPGGPERLRDPRRSEPRRSDPRRSDPRRSDPRGSDPRGSDPRAAIHGAGRGRRQEGRRHAPRTVRPGKSRPGPATPSRRRGPGPPRRLIPRANPGRRLGITLLAIAFVLTLFAGRLVQLQGFEAGPYRTLASQQRAMKIELPALRGTITGANGEVLAMTVATYLVYADPPEIPAAQQPQVAAKLAADLGQPGRRRSSVSSSTRPRRSTWCWPRTCPRRKVTRSPPPTCPASRSPRATPGPTPTAIPRPTSSASPAPTARAT